MDEAADVAALAGYAANLELSEMLHRLDSADLRRIQMMLTAAMNSPDFGWVMIGRIGTINEHRFGADPFTGRLPEDER